MPDDGKELISVIVPVYNVEKYLDRCMASLLAQTYTKLEIILVDDGSTDNSGLMCDGYAQKDRRIKVVHKENGGLSDARNAGLKIAHGAFIGYVDSDDWIEADMYEKMYQACMEHDAQLAVCRYAREYKDHSDTGGSAKTVALDRDELLRIYICGHEEYIIYNSVWSKLYKRELVDGLIFPKGRNSEDIMYTTAAFCRLVRAVYLDECLYHYVIGREGSIMNASSEKRMFEDELPFWREHIACISSMASKEMGALAAYHFWRRLLFYYTDAMALGQRHIADRLCGEIRRDSPRIREVYRSGIVSKGDRIRMRIFMRAPRFYYIIVRMYDKLVVPLRSGVYAF